MPSQIDSADLPPYTHPAVHAGPAFVEHTFTSDEDGQKQPALILKVQSLAQSVKYLPTFMGGEPVVGSVELNLPKAAGIESVILVFKGIMETRRMASYVSPRKTGPLTFFKFRETLWDVSKGDPNYRSSGENKVVKLQGEYTWNFAVTLPQEVTFDDEKKYKDASLAGTLSLPPHFSEKGCFSTVTYEMGVLVKHSGVFQSDLKVRTRYGYAPRSTPDAPSPLRQKAYSEGISLLGLDVDPEGWKIFSVNVLGKLFCAMDVGLKCTVALATPLAYTRGSVIPCMLILESSNTQAIDILSDVKSPCLGLFREFMTTSALERLAWGDDRRVMEARWWKPNDRLAEGSELSQRILHGEINIPANIQPSFSFGDFFQKYHVELWPFNAAGFVTECKDKLLKVDVQIMTDYAPGPRPRCYLPPEYSNGKSNEHTQRDAISFVPDGFL
ncbi:hypothetical protein BD410DRAFT_791522 [Rickenella mellea]|uniref:Arrestin-like N-terminal domain-containing protein n=1 Tax=Rickenella mellea TaxID=50990 RepID=A0A4Y7PXY2_9AGAM|nr:hypothetical protein BD410DRAFT_791522 [Rickenella mellea]